MKETAFSGAIPLIASLSAGRGAVRVHDPFHSRDELERLGLVPYVLGEPVDVVIIHTDHAAYRTLTPEDLPGVKVVVDGRSTSDHWTWRAPVHHVLGRGVHAVDNRGHRLNPRGES